MSLLSWYKSTNTDAFLLRYQAAAPHKEHKAERVARESCSRRKSSVLRTLLLLTLLMTLRLLAMQEHSSSAVQESRGDGGRGACGACRSKEDAFRTAVCNRQVRPVDYKRLTDLSIQTCRFLLEQLSVITDLSIPRSCMRQHAGAVCIDR